MSQLYWRCHRGTLVKEHHLDCIELKRTSGVSEKEEIGISGLRSLVCLKG